LKKSINQVKEYEKIHGLFGIISMESEIQELATKKLNTDTMKGKTLEEISSIVDQL